MNSGFVALCGGLVGFEKKKDTIRKDPPQFDQPCAPTTLEGLGREIHAARFLGLRDVQR